jgi:succinyl-CoA synthetase alpha subunit
MSILVDKNTRLLVQGITGKVGMFHAENSIKYGTTVVGGTSPGKGGEKVLDRPVFNTVADASRPPAPTPR